MSVYESNEELARQVGEDRKRLLRRLRETRSVLRHEYRRLFTKASRFDFENKRLVSECGTYALQWRLRLDPSQPESYENQQTSGGCVTFEKLQ